MTERRTIRSLTGIRGIAAIWVVFYHMQDLGRFEPRLSWLTTLGIFREGFRGVDLFFILSGFIIMLVHRNDFVRLDGNALLRYAKLRFGRVYPLNAAVLIAILALYAVIPGFHSLASLDAAGIIQSFLLAQRWLIADFNAINGPAWSLSVEILGYAAFPIVAFRLNRVRSRPLLLLGALLCLLSLIGASLVLGFAWHNITGRLAIVRMFPAFVAGAALAAFFASGLGRAHGRVAIAGGHLASVSVVVLLVICSVPGTGFLAALPIAGIVLGLAYEEGKLNRMMASGMVFWLGQISFSLYLTNFTVLGLLSWWTEGAREPAGPAACLAYTVATLAAVIGVAAATYYGAERPLARLTRNLAAGRWRGWPARGLGIKS